MYAKLACYTCYKSVISRNLIECSLSYSNSVICNNISVADAEILKTLAQIYFGFACIVLTLHFHLLL